MSRYFYYLVFTNMLVNVLAFVPKILMRDRYDGAVMALFISAVIGTFFICVFTHAISKFPRQGLPEILDTIAPVWLRNGLLILFAVFLYLGGMVTVLAFADYTRKFLNPDISMTTITSLYLAIIIIVSRFKTEKVLYLLEILLIVSVPLTLFILFKSFFNKDMRWDDIAAVAVFFPKVPKWADIAAISYIFSGYVNLAMFNPAFQPFKPKWLWPIGVIGLIISCITMFIPIGFLGADAAGHYVFPWMSTSDSMRIELGFIERVLYIFMFLYGYIVFAGMIIHWHGSLELLKHAIPLNNLSTRFRKWKSWIFAALFCLGTIVCVYYVDDNRLYYWGELWLDFRLPAECLVVALVVYAARRLKS